MNPRLIIAVLGAIATVVKVYEDQKEGEKQSKEINEYEK